MESMPSPLAQEQVHWGIVGARTARLSPSPSSADPEEHHPWRNLQGPGRVLLPKPKSHGGHNQSKHNY